MKDFDVVVIGAGPAGILLALEMDKSCCPKKVLVVDSGSKYRSSGLSCAYQPDNGALQDLQHYERLSWRRLFRMESFL